MSLLEGRKKTKRNKSGMDSKQKRQGRQKRNVEAKKVWRPKKKDVVKQSGLPEESGPRRGT